MTRFGSRATTTDAQAFFEEAYSFPSGTAALIALAMGDVAIAVSMILSLG